MKFFILVTILWVAIAYGQLDNTSFCEQSSCECLDNDPINYLEVEPVFQGGEEKLLAYVNDNLVYPTEGPELHGIVFISFIIDKCGCVDQPKVTRGLSPQYDEEAIKVVASMPIWTPVTNGQGEYYCVKYTLPVKFK